MIFIYSIYLLPSKTPMHPFKSRVAEALIKKWFPSYLTVTIKICCFTLFHFWDCYGTNQIFFNSQYRFLLPFTIKYKNAKWVYLCGKNWWCFVRICYVMSHDVYLTSRTTDTSWVFQRWFDSYLTVTIKIFALLCFIVCIFIIILNLFTVAGRLDFTKYM